MFYATRPHCGELASFAILKRTLARCIYRIINHIHKFYPKITQLANSRAKKKKNKKNMILPLKRLNIVYKTHNNTIVRRSIFLRTQRKTIRKYEEKMKQAENFGKQSGRGWFLRTKFAPLHVCFTLNFLYIYY